IARSLSPDIFDVVVAFGGEGLLKDKLTHANIRTIPIEDLERDINIFNEIEVFFQLLKLYRVEKPDIVHLNSSKIGGIGALTARIARVPLIIFTAHGWAFNEERSWGARKIIAFLYWITLILSHTTIAVSKQIKNQVRHFPFTKHKITVIYNGVDQAGVFSKEEARELLLRHNKKMSQSIPADAFWIGTVSELHITKGLGYAIEAVENLIKKGKNVVFIIISEGEERHNLQRLIEEKALTGKVFLFGFIDAAPQYLRAFDIFTLTSISEALSLSILEAGLSERAVVASDVGGIPEIITSGETGLLVPTRDPGAISEAISSLIEDEEKRNKFGKQLKQKVVSKFSLQEMLTKTVEVYQS
ncbi:glycosyltransferase family 4 protein, partial [Candidatus Kaiserbacteria bacterium]|nr:glycosyltransferase family 4 protein [Candidatus Kaiserbacteria bacterium]